MAYKALNACGLPYDLIRSDDIRKGRLADYNILFVPGGWASNKIKALGSSGADKIRDFVKAGGSYLGFCGGAGLATLDGVGLLNLRRKSSKKRVPSFSGRIYLNTNEHPIWQFVNRDRSPLSVTDTKHGHESHIFHAWWPSQFVIKEKDVRILATFGDALPDAFSSDIPVGDICNSDGWQELEEIYGINLDPERLRNEPAVVEGNFGKGRVILSLIHFDTPNDENGARVLKNLWEYLSGERDSATARQCDSAIHHCFTALPLCRSMETAVEELISLGIRNFLWFWRNPLLLQWRRGVRGLEYCALHVMIKEIARILSADKAAYNFKKVENQLDAIKKLLLSFAGKAERLLIMERLAMCKSHITYRECEDHEIKKIREG
ncbi:MAG: BPL-N domain-containing protein, partial [Nitrospirae bacterium]|nr:BPL-N domain-containing protein [Nitrospirota bacterium]